MATVFHRLALASAMVAAAILPASAETIFALTFPLPMYYWTIPPAFYDDSPLGYIEAGMRLCAKSTVITVKDLKYRQIIIAGGQIILIDTSEGLPRGVHDPANDKKCQKNPGLYAQQSNPRYAQVFDPNAQSAWRNRVSSSPVAASQPPQVQSKPVAPLAPPPASAQTFVSVIFTTPMKYYASLNDYALPEAVSRRGQIEAGMHLCVANQLIRYRDTKLAQLVLPDGQVVYVDYAEAWGSYNLDPANNKKCQAQYAALTRPLQKNAAPSGMAASAPPSATTANQGQQAANRPRAKPVVGNASPQTTDLVGKFNATKALAEGGDPEAERELGLMYTNGKGTAKNVDLGAGWVRKAADQGDVKAKSYIGTILYAGAKTSDDFREAMTLLRDAADHGDEAAQFQVGVMYDSGEGVKEDAQEGLRWLRLAADQGDAMAKTFIGKIYYRGDPGVAKDVPQAVKWFISAAEGGDADGQCLLGGMYGKGEDVSKDRDAALKWLRAGADQGEALCYYELALLSAGQSPPDYRTAEQWARKAANEGDAGGEYLLALLLDGKPGARTQQLSWLRKSAAQGNDDAKRELARLSGNGRNSGGR